MENCSLIWNVIALDPNTLKEKGNKKMWFLLPLGVSFE